MATRQHRVDVCIVGGGPAGLLLGLLLAKQGIRTLVLEQHQDFEREYRGEVLMPRFAQLFSRLGLLDYIESFPHSKLKQVEIFSQDEALARLSLSEIYPPHPYALWMPQPIFLDALRQKAETFPAFELWFGATAEALIQENDVTLGVQARHGEELVEISARVTVGADGRTSRLHRLGGFEDAYRSYDFDVIWFSIPQPENYTATTQFYFRDNRRAYLLLPKYPKFIQCGFMTAPGEFAQLRKQGVSAMQNLLLQGPKAIHAFARELSDFKPFHPLQARISFTRQWAKNGLLLVGDAAHTCSPAGAIGVSIALETAAVAADVIADALAQGDVSERALSQVQAIRQSEIQTVQRLQQNVTRFMFREANWLMRILPRLAKWAFRLGLAQRFPRRLLVNHSPLPLSERLIFKPNPQNNT